jgi:aminomethyltransferase
LGARDSLRLEASYPLHGHELGEEVTALESGLGWIVKPDGRAFIGKEALARQRAAGVPRALVGLIIDDPGIARHGDAVCDLEGRQVGVVTSGTKTPTVNRAIALALVATEHATPEIPLRVKVRERMLACHTVKLPFYSALKPSRHSTPLPVQPPSSMAG